MKIFISYARVDKPFCIQLVETLVAHDVWYDQRLYAGQHWWKEILRRLDWCEIFVYLLSPESIASVYCQKELDIAQRIGREIIPIIIQPGVEIPQSIANLHCLDMSEGFSPENVAMLLNSTLNAERILRGSSPSSTVKSVPKDKRNPPVTPTGQIVSMGASALQNGDYDRAVFLFKQAKANGFKSRFININALLAEAEHALENQARLKEAEREYRQIVDLFKYERTRVFALEAFRGFHEEFSDYDPKNLRRYLDTPPGQQPRTGPLRLREKVNVLPLLDWCETSAGSVLVESLTPNGYKQETLVYVDAFLISKYPVTNKQFDTFIADPDGYQNEVWWQFDTQALTWFREHQKPLPSKFQGDARPRENVTWFEARAFSHWLSHLTGLQVTLPTLAQWQRAAQGDDERMFPWGDGFETSFCNTRESGLKMTTEVSRYEAGISPFGVRDMAGNVWEWCLDQMEDENGETKYAVVGGSYVSPCDRAKASFHYHLNPASRYSSIGIRLVALDESVNLPKK